MSWLDHLRWQSIPDRKSETKIWIPHFEGRGVIKQHGWRQLAERWSLDSDLRPNFCLESEPPDSSDPKSSHILNPKSPLYLVIKPFFSCPSFGFICFATTSCCFFFFAILLSVLNCWSLCVTIIRHFSHWQSFNFESTHSLIIYRLTLKRGKSERTKSQMMIWYFTRLV